jgi:predicted peptidase
MTWLVIREHPERFAAAVPCCPRTDYIGDFAELDRLAALPIWCIHGEGDAVTPPDLSERLKKVLLKNAARSGADTRFLILPTGYLFPDGVTKTPVDHLVWIPMFSNLLYNDGTKYRDRDGSEVQSTLIKWLGEQVLK